MVVRQRHAETVLVHEFELQARKRIQRIAHDAQVERPIVQAFDNAIGGGLVQLHVDARVGALQLRQCLRQQAIGCAADEGQPQGADVAACGVPGEERQPFGVPQDLHGFGQQQRAGLGQRDAAPSAHEQPGAQPRLQLRDGDRQRRLRDMELLGGAAQVQFGGDNAEVAQALQVHACHEISHIVFIIKVTKNSILLIMAAYLSSR